MCQSAWRRRTALACVRTALALTALTLFLSCTSWAQLPQAGDTTSPPTPGVGHDYIHSPVETVNPANGSVSIRIPVRISSGRELTIPFNIAYDSSGAFYYGSQGNTPGLLTVTGVPFSQGGWSYTFPLATNAEIDWDHPGVNGGRDYPCTESANYVFQDPSGSRHNLGLLWAPKGPGGQECGSSILTGGEGPILATASSGDGSTTLTDGNGTVYSFPANNGVGGLPTGITDRNGNTVTISSTPTSATVTDTAGRAAISVGSFGGAPDNINVAGTLSPYQVFWTTASANYSINVVNLDPNFDPNCGTSLSGSVKAVSEIVLPNGQKYTFSYNSFGMLSEITYPSGGHVRYVWGLHNSSSLPEAGFWTDGTTAYTCLYDVPTIADRYVSFDGTTEPLHQQFSYSTSWQSGSDEYTSKTTTVTTTDSVTGTSFKTVYTYTAVLAPNVPMGEARSGSEQTVQIPVEQTVQYDGTNGSPIKTVGKTWCNVRELCSETTTLNDTNQVSEVTYSYNTNEQQTEKDEYDYGSGAHGPLLRKTVTSYASFTGAHIVDLPSGVITYDGSGNRAAETDSSYDQTGLQTTSVVQHGSAGTARGNLTTVTKDCFVGSTTCASGNATTTYSYYDTGQIYQMTDPKLNVTTFSYTDSYSSCGGNAPPAGATNAYLTQVTYPQTGTVSHVESYCYDYSAGLLRGSTDQNGQTSTYTYADSLDRLTLANYPDGGQTIVSYNDAGPTPSVTTEKKLDTSGRFVTTVNFTNGMGLPIETELTSDPQGTDLTVTSYDGLGRAHTVTNPYRSTSDPTYGLTINSYDALGRTLSVQKPDGSTVSTSYSGNCTTVTDEAGKNRESCTDGLGRMTEVIENPGGLGYMTNYTYDTLDDLTSVVQGGSRNRSFAYDSLKRMTQSVNPESGTINYIYDANGNVSTKTDNRSITTAYSYDALNRVTGMTYSNGDPAVSYTYDQSACLGQSACYNIGHRTTVTDAGGNEEFAYDKAGREIAEQRTTSGHTKSTSYGYDLAGDMTSLVYPSGRTITYTYDSAGRPSDAVDTANSINYEVGPCTNGASTSPTTGVCYAPNGAVTQEQNGTNLVTTYIYNKRFQPCWMYGTTGSPLATSTTCTAADPGPGNILDLQYNFNLGAGDNGNVVGITNNRDTTRSESFTYDALNRIATGQTGATSGANCWGQSYTIDQWGNLTNIGHVSGYSACSQGSLSVSALTNNQLSSTGFSYDGAGNMTNDGANAYTYNAESETTSAAGVTYTYDGDGNRVEKANGRLFWYGAGTEILDESDLTGSITLEMVYFGGKRVAHRTSSNVIYYYEGDMLGSARSIVQAGATAVCYDADFLPFGGERDIVNTCSQNYKFEGKKRDLETGNDDFGARYYRSNLGRWMSADWSSVPAPVPYANLTNPQTLNLYAMVSDNPETFADLDGHDNNCTYGPLGQESCKSTANSNANAPATTGEGHSQPDPQKNGTNTPNSTTDQVLQVAKEAVDWFNNNLGFANGKSTCASGGSCANAVGMAATTVLATVASDGGSAAGKAPAIEELIAKSAQAIENHAQELTEETLARASSEVNGGMKVAKVGGGEFSHAAKVEQRMNGLNRQARHLERLLGRSGLSESHIQTINGLIERAAGLAARALQAITPRQPI